MAYREFETTLGDDAAPVSSRKGVRCLRGNLVELVAKSPCAPASQSENDYTQGNQTTSTSYDDSSILWRFPFTFVRARQGFAVRQLRFDFWAVTSANTATIQVCVGPAFRVPESPVVWPDISKATNGGDVTTTAAWHSITFGEIGEEQMVNETLGAPPDGEDRRGAIYPTTYVTVRGKMEAAGQLTVSRMLPSEV